MKCLDFTIRQTQASHLVFSILIRYVRELRMSERLLKILNKSRCVSASLVCIVENARCRAMSEILRARRIRQRYV